MEIRTKRWDEPRAPGDGLRVLVCRFRPRALPKAKETWDAWIADAGPSPALHSDAYGKAGAPIGWPEYERRYLAEIGARPAVVDKLLRMAPRGSAMTLLCSASCLDPARCHRTLLKAVLERRAAALGLF